MIEPKFWNLFEILTFRCVCEPIGLNKSKCKHEIKYEELYRLGDYKEKVGLSHRCEKLPLKCKTCDEIVTEEDKIVHYNMCRERAKRGLKMQHKQDQINQRISVSSVGSVSYKNEPSDRFEEVKYIRP